MNTAIKNHPFALLATVGIVILSTIPIPEDAPLGDVPMIDKWVHFVMYGGLTCCIWLDYYLAKNRKVTMPFAVMSIVCPMLLGGLMELVQAYLTTCRNGDWIDFWADDIGVILGFALSFVVFRTVAHTDTTSSKIK